MANVAHSTLTGADLHEPKGAALATAGQVYVADGSGSGDWTIRSNDVLSGYITDISTAGSVYVPIPNAGTVTKVVTVLEGAIGTADAVITVYDDAAASMGTITVAFTGSAAGDVDTLSPTSNNTVTDNTFIRIATSGASTNTIRLWYSISVVRT